MIRTRFGSEVEIVKGDMATGEVDFYFKDNKRHFLGYINELKADGGIAEINETIEKANNQHKT